MPKNIYYIESWFTHTQTLLTHTHFLSTTLWILWGHAVSTRVSKGNSSLLINVYWENKWNHESAQMLRMLHKLKCHSNHWFITIYVIKKFKCHAKNTWLKKEKRNLEALQKDRKTFTGLYNQEKVPVSGK